MATYKTVRTKSTTRAPHRVAAPSRTVGASMDLLGNKVCRIVEANGFVFVRHTKHDAHYVHPDYADRWASIPRCKSPLAMGTLHSIIRSSKEPRSHFC